jgi:hypothetical protein
MRVAAIRRIGVSKQRGFWLRCFLGGGLLLGLMSAAFPQPIRAQITPLRPLRIRHIQGYVTDEKGNAIGLVTVELLRDGKPVIKTRADEVGWFRFDGVSGRYVLTVSTRSSEVGRDVAVGTNLITLFFHKTLYVMARVNQFCDDCSLRVYTSGRKFFDEVWRNTGHYY